MILEKYYEIIDRPSQEVSRIWKIMHIVFLAAGAITGLTASYSFGMTLKQFSDNCILYPVIVLKDNYNDLSLNSTMPGVNKSIDLISTRWGDDWICQYCQFVPMMSIVLGPILIAFFMMIPRGGTNFNKSCSVERSWHIVVPCIILTGIYTIILLTSLFKLSNGLQAFCQQFDDLWMKNTTNLNNTDICAQLMNQFSDEISEGVYGHQVNYILSANAHMFVTIYFKSACILFWLLTCLSLCLRIICVADFKIVEVVIETDERRENLLRKLKATTSDTESTESDTVTLEV